MEFITKMALVLIVGLVVVIGGYWLLARLGKTGTLLGANAGNPRFGSNPFG